jgi:hypothetical protein
VRIPIAAHESRPWRIREIAPDFTLEDVWALPVHGDAEDFQAVLEMMGSFDLANPASLATRVLPIAPLYRTDVECAGEVSNQTVDGVIHLAWVDKGEGRYQGQMAIYVKPRGLLGNGYIALIKPPPVFGCLPSTHATNRTSLDRPNCSWSCCVLGLSSRCSRINSTH